VQSFIIAAGVLLFADVAWGKPEIYKIVVGESIMKVVFLEDIANIARAGDVKEVADGYGRNFLLPKGLATLATPAIVAKVKATQQTYAAQQARSEQELAELASELDGKEITLRAKVGAKDRLYGAITSADIAREVRERFAIDIDKRDVGLERPLHQLGNFEITIRLAKNLTPRIRLTVEKEQ
jgi:large subunit ribosomal protein L9